jgi:HEPN domain-containing protein
MNTEGTQHVQETFLALGDEFLVQYFLCADRRFRQNQMLSRLFSMGHSLELYLKAALAAQKGVPPVGHDIPALILQFDPSMALSTEEVATGQALFASDVRNFDIGLQMRHEEALELYQAQYFVRDLKYYLTRDQRVIFPVRHSLKPVNWRYLDLAKRLRASIKLRHPEQDRKLVELVDQLGFEINPALSVVGDAV